MSGMMSISGWPEGGPMVPGEKGNTAAKDVQLCRSCGIETKYSDLDIELETVTGVQAGSQQIFR